jgi:hypothetical protein
MRFLLLEYTLGEQEYDAVRFYRCCARLQVQDRANDSDLPRCTGGLGQAAHNSTREAFQISFTSSFHSQMLRLETVRWVSAPHFVAALVVVGLATEKCS